MTGESFGSTAMDWNPFLRDLITSLTPVIVPPVPTAETRMSALPSVSFQISSAVVRRCISGLAGLSNCCGIHESAISLCKSSALLIAPFMPSVAGVRTSLAPSNASKVRRSALMLSGIVKMSLYPLAAATKASAMPVLPEVGSMIVVWGVRMPSRSAAAIMALPMRSFTLPSGLKNSPFNAIVATGPLTIRFSLISGVRPTVLITSGYTGIITFLSLMGLVLQIRRVGDELAILRQDHAQRRYQGSFLQIARRRLRRFQDDLKGPRAHLGRRAQCPRVSIAYDAVARAKAVNGLTRIARQELLRRLERRFDQVLGQRRPSCKPIEALAADRKSTRLNS